MALYLRLSEEEKSLTHLIYSTYSKLKGKRIFYWKWTKREEEKDMHSPKILNPNAPSID